jgi:N-carbamoyl-L-amino-acid hydrolase
MNQAAAAVSEKRQWDRLMAMARLGAIPGDGVNRACLTDLDRQARRLLVGWASEIGATVSLDAAANLWLRREGSDPRPWSPAATWTPSRTADASTASTA